ncbi:ATP-binding cassette domain-containing protein [Castellaniella sp.]|uniref:branched-chain amino acid ABC transporter ATP-binding protein/permease n=1 Tax=Castellaniella sp. TaxID=1955812 RepID=UPI00355D1480
MDYLLYIGVMIAIYVILSTSFNLLIGIGGLFALSHAAFYSFGAYSTAILATRYGLAFPLPMLVGILVAASIGALVALPALRISGVYLVIVTLALQFIVVNAYDNGGSLTGGTDGLPGIAPIEIAGIQLSTPGKFLPLAVLMAVFCLWFGWRLVHSPYGRALRAMRENEIAVQAAGKNVVAMKLTIFAVSSGLAAIAGSLFARYFQYVGPQSFGVEETIYILAMVIIGGTGNLWGSALGAALLVALPEGLKYLDMPVDVADKTRLLLYGVLLIVILRFRPEGLIAERGSDRRSLAGVTAIPLTQAAPVRQPDSAATVEGRDLYKAFGGVVAVSGCNIALRAGTVTGLIGPNGAGKTTAFNLLTGFLKPDRGTVLFNGRSVVGLKPYQIVRNGMARSFQDLRLYRRMTVLDNVVVSLPDQSGDSLWAVFMRPAHVRRQDHENTARALGVLEFVGLAHKALERAEDLSYAEEKLLVIARLLATQADVLLFDEPLSGLDPLTLDGLLPVFRKIAAHGKTVCIIEHNLDVIKSLCDVVYFLDEGKTLAVGTPAELMGDPELAARYFK